ncbi:FecR family protein [Ancylomarina longa]|uniref:DUF4974 domain-containing protein n=1 Tax=Ancylomarina longa TaxID=2487017 RepID=A0A434AFB1_9BACT|nr:FecR domain-containing protein [Ancylomarina longa]RUT73032.1 DUF4974 domain-containing protein [Ancylomarina longa]
MKEKKSYNIDWENISKYLSGEMEEMEKVTFEQLMDSNPEYAQALVSSKKDLYQIDKIHEIQNHFNTDSAWSSVKSRIVDTKKSTKENEVPVFSMSNWKKLLQLAAMFLLIIGLGYASFQVYTHNSLYQTFASKSNETRKTIVLADGSKVTLNANSRLVYPKEFRGKERRVQLKGEAFFNISKNPNKPFIISVENAEIKVLGTSFSVMSKSDHVEVLVETGKVQFARTSNPAEKLILEKGDFGVLMDSSIQKTSMKDENYLSWKTRKLVFKNMPLKAVSEVIDRTYQVQIRFEDSAIMKNNINTSFDDTPLDDVLENLCLPYHLTYEKNGNQILIHKIME